MNFRINKYTFVNSFTGRVQGLAANFGWTVVFTWDTGRTTWPTIKVKKKKKIQI